MMKRKNRLLALGAALLLLFGCAPAEGSGSSAPLPPQEPAVFSAPDPEPPEPVRGVEPSEAPEKGVLPCCRARSRVEKGEKRPVGMKIFFTSLL